MRTITVPATSPRVFSEAWRHCVGTGTMSEHLHAECQEHLALVQRQIGFRHIRGHGLFSEKMHVCRDGLQDGHKPLSLGGDRASIFTAWTYVDRVFDHFLDVGIRPFLELTFMPDNLASGPETVFHWKGNITPARDPALWNELIRRLLVHLIERYGIDEVSRWPIEVWNEPDLKFFWKDGDQARYFQLYADTARTVKAVDERLRVGGPATCPGAHEWIEPFLALCDRDRVPVDFVATHGYIGRPSTHTGEISYQELGGDGELMAQVRKAHGFIEQSFRPDLPLYFTEFNTSYEPLCPVHDTAFNGAHLARFLTEAGDLAESFSYWTCSDVFEEAGVPSSYFHGGFGLVAHGSVPKPTFHLFAFLARMGHEQLHRDERCLVTRARDGRVAVLAWNPCMELADRQPLHLRFDLPAPAADVAVERQRVDDERGNAWQAWRMLGRPRDPSRALVDRLRDAARPAVEWSRHQAVAGRVTIDVVLSPNEVTCVELRPRSGDSALYRGLDDRKVPGVRADV